MAQQQRIDVPGGDYISVAIERITPEEARRMLENNHANNRKVRQADVDRYAQQMRKGLWYCDTGESLKFTDKNTLIDGQHRLAAVATLPENMAVNFLVFRNIAESHINAIDSGRKRTLADVLTIRDIHISGLGENVLSALITGLWSVAKYTRTSHTISDNYRFDNGVYSGSKLSIVEQYEFFDKNPQIVDTLKLLEGQKAASLGKAVPLTGNLLGWYVVAQLDQGIAQSIFECLRDGTPKTEAGYKCPSYIMLKHILRTRQEGIHIRKTEYIAYWLWAFENMALNKQRASFVLSPIYKPGQGHHGYQDLVEIMKTYKI